MASAAMSVQGALGHVPSIPFKPRLNTNLLTRFVDPLPIPAIARSHESRPSPEDPDLWVPYYRVEMRQLRTRIHRELQPTTMWGYGATVPGPTFEARGSQGLIVEWVNRLPSRHLLPIDHGIHGAEAGKPEVRAVVHLHGARTKPESDGYPEAWYEPGRSALYYYPNNQEAATLWYHDHTLGITRLNIFAGLFGAFLIRDDFEDGLNLPKGEYEIPMLVFDRSVDLSGQLNYMVSPFPESPWVSEFTGNAVLINGKLFPYLEVEPRRYRWRIINAANFRTFHLTLSNSQPFHQIGSDQGLLTAPVELTSLVLAPAERADLIVDFAGHRGQQILVRNDETAVMQLKVLDRQVTDTSALPPVLRPMIKTHESEAVKTRILSLDDYEDSMGNTSLMLLNGTHWNMPVTERPVINTVEIWSFANLTEDVHPIHLHLVRFQILDRRRFDLLSFRSTRTLRYTGPPVAPDANEAGWKDTVRAFPNMVTRIIVRFEGFTGRYVWHCHILEHEDNEMMRPYEVVADTDEAMPRPWAQWCGRG